jgi:MscS family membrane protein
MPTDHTYAGWFDSAWKTVWKTTLAPCVLLIACAAACAAGTPETADPAAMHPLEPVDTSGPRETIRSFRETGDRLFAHITRADFTPDFLPQMRMMAAAALHCLDLRDIAPSLTLPKGRQSAVFIKEVLDRIELPPAEEIPDAVAAANLKRWRIPHTEIALERITDGPREGDWVFCSNSVDRAEEFFRRVRHVPYRTDAGSPGLYEAYVHSSGWMIPESLIDALPGWAREVLFGICVWQWFAMALLLAAGTAAVIQVFCWKQRAADSGAWLLAHLLAFAAPASLAVICLVIDYLLTYQVRVTGHVLFATKSALRVAEFVGGILFVHAALTRLSEVFIRSRRLRAGAIDTELMRMGFRLLTFCTVAWMTFAAASSLGIPVAPLVAGLGVSGLAVALAAQHTVENLIGGLVLFTDKPVRIGDVCQFAEFRGTVEQIGLRSTRIRGTDRSMISVPNSEFAKLKLVNLTRRDRIVFSTTLALRRDVDATRLRTVLATLRTALDSHPHIDPDSARVRIVGYTAGSLDLEAQALVDTTNGDRFLTIQEELTLRLLDVLHDSGCGLAPSADAASPPALRLGGKAA